MELNYDSEETGNVAVTVYESVPVGSGMPDSIVPLVSINQAFAHSWLNSFDVIRTFDTNLIYEVFTTLKPEYLNLHYDLHYQQGGLRTRYVSVYRGQVTGIAEFMDDFMGDSSVMRYISAVRTNEDRTIHTNRYSHHNKVLTQLADSSEVSWLVVV
jgi:hypothetical protein